MQTTDLTGVISGEVLYQCHAYTVKCGHGLKLSAEILFRSEFWSEWGSW